MNANKRDWFAARRMAGGHFPGLGLLIDLYNCYIILFHFISLCASTASTHHRTGLSIVSFRFFRIHVWMLFLLFFFSFWSASLVNQPKRKYISEKEEKRKTERKLNVIKDIDRFHGSWSDASVCVCVCIRFNPISFHFDACVYTVWSVWVCVCVCFSIPCWLLPLADDHIPYPI